MKTFVQYDPATGAIQAVVRVARNDSAPETPVHLSQIEISPLEDMVDIVKNKTVDVNSKQLKGKGA